MIDAQIEQACEEIAEYATKLAGLFDNKLEQDIVGPVRQQQIDRIQSRLDVLKKEAVRR